MEWDEAHYLELRCSTASPCIDLQWVRTNVGLTGGCRRPAQNTSLTLLSFLNRPVPQQTRLSSLQNNAFQNAWVFMQYNHLFQWRDCSCVSLGIITDSTKSFIHFKRFIFCFIKNTFYSKDIYQIIKKYSIDIYNVTQDFCFKQMLFLNFLFSRLKMYHCFHKNMKQHNCFRHW